MKSVAIIPARYGSSRFPGKPLADIAGKSMIQRVYEQVSRSDLLERVIVATDDVRIRDHITDFGGEALMTAAEHNSGTDRCAEVAKSLHGVDIVLNIQGDEPFILAEQIDRLIKFLKRSGSFQIATLIKKVDESRELFSPNTVKVVRDASFRALYFSRHPIPFQRSLDRSEWTYRTFYKHLGVYAFKRKTLLELAELPESPLEVAEKLEQLRWLENGYAIGLVETEHDTVGIDTPQELAEVLSRLREV